MKAIILVILLVLINYSYQQTCSYLNGVEFIGCNLPSMPFFAASSLDCCNLCNAYSSCLSW
jgi:hypothetical protein